MNTEVTESTPYGLFRYLYNHYQVRYPEMHMSMGAVLTNDVLDAVDAIDSSDLQTHLAKDSWLIGIGRPDREAGNGYTWQLWHVSCLAVDAGERPEICIYQTLPESALSPEVYTLDLAACQRSPYESTPNIVS